MPGGAQRTGVTTTPVTIDLSELADYEVDIWSDEQDIWVGFGPDTSDTDLVIAGDLAASRSRIKGRRAARGYPLRRKVWNRFPVLVVRTQSGTATVHVQVVAYRLEG